MLESFAASCQPLKNVPFERYRFYSRMQDAGESYDHYRTALRQLADRCEFETISADQMLRDKLVFGIRTVCIKVDELFTLKSRFGCCLL